MSVRCGAAAVHGHRQHVREQQAKHAGGEIGGWTDPRPGLARLLVSLCMCPSWSIAIACARACLATRRPSTLPTPSSSTWRPASGTTTSGQVGTHACTTTTTTRQQPGARPSRREGRQAVAGLICRVGVVIMSASLPVWVAFDGSAPWRRGGVSSAAHGRVRPSALQVRRSSS